jgi:hypothetical protein
VSLKTTVKGGIRYYRTDLEDEEVAEETEGIAASIAGNLEEVTRWKTTRVIDDVAERERAMTARNEGARLVRGICSETGLGLLCPVSREDELNEAIKRARQIATEFNETAATNRLSIYALKGRIAETDEEATRALTAEVRGLLEQMDGGIRDLDVKKIRDAASKARAMGQMLDVSQQERVGDAITAARKAAREITKRVTKAGEDGGVVLRDLYVKPIDNARFAFIDSDEDETTVDQLALIDRQRFADIGDESDVQEVGEDGV